MKKEYFDQMEKMPGVQFNRDKGIMVLPLPSTDNPKAGSIVTYLTSPNVYVRNISIYCTKLPEYLEKNYSKVPLMKINCCLKGRCELELINGEYIYVTGGEIAIDTGYSKDAWYYPSAEYEGIEILIAMVDGWQDDFILSGMPMNSPMKLVNYCKNEKRPIIISITKKLLKIAKEIREYADEKADKLFIFVKTLEFILELAEMNFSEEFLRRTYHTKSQVEIAKRVRNMITKDLSKRYTAKELAEIFGISETSLKNYFRSVYGCGYADYQNEQRMKKAAQLLAEETIEVGKIAELIGYSSQSKFGVAFKKYYGATPLEYRRNARL